MKLLKSSAAVLAAILLAACAADAPKELPRDPSLVEVTFYRDHNDLHAKDYPFIFVDKDKRGPLADKSVVKIDVKAGTHRMSLSNPALWDADQYWTFNAVAGRKYYFRLWVGEGAGPEGSLPRYVSRFARVDEVPEARALADIELIAPPPAED